MKIQHIEFCRDTSSTGIALACWTYISYLGNPGDVGLTLLTPVLQQRDQIQNKNKKMASDAEKKKSIPNIADASIEIINTGIVQAEKSCYSNIYSYRFFCWDFLEQRENWLEAFNCSLNFAFVKNDVWDSQKQRSYRDCKTKFQSYDQACFCKVKIEVRKLKGEPKESIVHTLELASWTLTLCLRLRSIKSKERT